MGDRSEEEGACWASYIRDNGPKEERDIQEICGSKQRLESSGWEIGNIEIREVKREIFTPVHAVADEALSVIRGLVFPVGFEGLVVLCN